MTTAYGFPINHEDPNRDETVAGARTFNGNVVANANVMLGNAAADLVGFHGVSASRGTIVATSLTSASSYVTVGSNLAAILTAVSNILLGKGAASQG